jgi:undecaprenyl-diphosphatase
MDDVDRGTYYFFQFDRVHNPGTPFHGPMTVVSYLGGAALLIAVAFITARLVRRGQARAGLLFLALFVGAALLVEVLGWALGQARPHDWRGAGPLQGFPRALFDLPSNRFGFPSGAALLSALVYPALALVLWPDLPSGLARGVVLAVSVILVLALGASQMYLGYHFLSDVLAGWAGGVFLLLVVARPLLTPPAAGVSPS